jgi:prepilin-type N-terminal cleavage/methylation domain-containing protein
MNPMQKLWAFLSKKPKEASRGFTLIELLVVIAIIGVLSSVVLASLNTARKKGRDARRISDIKQMQLALELFYDSSDEGSYPIGTISVLDDADDGLVPNFISVLPEDPGSNDYYYRSLDDGGDECNTEPCESYVLRAELENSGGPLSNDLDDDNDDVASVECDDSTAPYYYCVRP